MDFNFGFSGASGGTSGGGTATGEISTVVYQGNTSFTLNAGTGFMKIGQTGVPSDFTVTTMDMKAGNTAGVVLPLQVFSVGPLSYGATYRISGIIELTPSAASSIFQITIQGGGYIGTFNPVILYTSVGTSLVELPFDTTTSNADIYSATNTFKLSTFFSASALYRIKELTITLTNS